MNVSGILAVSALLSLSAIGPATAQEQERSIRRAQLPAAVEQTVTQVAQGATIRGFAEEKENGQTFYEVELVVNGATRDILIDPAGTVVEIEQQVALDSLPEAVRAGLRAGAGSRRITQVESLTKRGVLVAYEAHLVSNGRRSELQVGPDGKPLDHEE
jgi:hypothetical protein